MLAVSPLRVGRVNIHRTSSSSVPECQQTGSYLPPHPSCCVCCGICGTRSRGRCSQTPSSTTRGGRRARTSPTGSAPARLCSSGPPSASRRTSCGSCGSSQTRTGTVSWMWLSTGWRCTSCRWSALASRFLLRFRTSSRRPLPRTWHPHRHPHQHRRPCPPVLRPCPRRPCLRLRLRPPHRHRRRLYPPARWRPPCGLSPTPTACCTSGCGPPRTRRAVGGSTCRRASCSAPACRPRRCSRCSRWPTATATGSSTSTSTCSPVTSRRATSSSGHRRRTHPP